MCVCVCACARPRKKARAAAGQRPLQGRRREAGGGRGTHPARQPRHKVHGAAGTARRAGAHTCVSSGSPQPPRRRSVCGAAGCTHSTRGVHAARRTAERGTDGPPRRAPLRNERAPRPGTVRPGFPHADTPSCARTAASAHRKGARPPRPPPSAQTRPPTGAPGPPGSPAQRGTRAHTVTAADGLSDEEERSVAYAWLQRTAWECVSADQRGSGPERTGRTEGG